jgi:hypothetical protein
MLGSTLSLLAQLRGGPKTEPKGPNFGPKIGSTLSLLTQITDKQMFSTNLNFEPNSWAFGLKIEPIFVSTDSQAQYWAGLLDLSAVWIYCEV